MYTADDIRKAFMRGACYVVRHVDQHGDIPSRVDTEVVADAYVSQQPVSAPAPAKPARKRSKKEQKPAGWSDGAWEHYLSAKGATTYAALAPEKIAARAMAKLDRTEEIRPPLNFRCVMYAGAHESPDGFNTTRTANDAAVLLGKLQAAGIRFETAEEYAVYQLRRREQGARAEALVTDTHLNGAYRVDTYLTRFYRVRTTAAELLAAGMRDEARSLLRILRGSERRVAAKLGLTPSFPGTETHPAPTRENHRKERRAKREAAERQNEAA